MPARPSYGLQTVRQTDMKEWSEPQETQHLQQVPWEQGSGRVWESLRPRGAHRLLLRAGD